MFNARIIKQPIGQILGTRGENTLNENGETLLNIATPNEFKITNIF